MIAASTLQRFAFPELFARSSRPRQVDQAARALARELGVPQGDGGAAA